MNVPYIDNETPEQEAGWRELAVAWKARFGDGEVTAAQVAELANPIKALPVKRDENGAVSVRSLGMRLLDIGELADGVGFYHRRGHKGSLYRLLCASAVGNGCQHNLVRCIDCGATLSLPNHAMLHQRHPC